MFQSAPIRKCHRLLHIQTATPEICRDQDAAAAAAEPGRMAVTEDLWMICGGFMDDLWMIYG